MIDYVVSYFFFLCKAFWIRMRTAPAKLYSQKVLFLVSLKVFIKKVTSLFLSTAFSAVLLDY